MKKSQLQQIIKEEIQNVLSEIDPTQQGFDAAMKRAGVEYNRTGGKNIMRPKLINIWFNTNFGYYKTLVDGERMDRTETEDLIKNLTGINIKLRTMDEEDLNKAYNILKSKNVKLTWDDSFDVS
jgi:hypothetical protein